MGGGERQMIAYRNHLARYSIDVNLFDMWKPNFQKPGIFHCFSVMPGTIELCDYAKKQGQKLVISPNLWVTKESKDNYPFQYIWNLFELADAIIVNSVMELNTLSTVFSIHESKFKVVYNAAEMEFLLPEDPSLFRKTFDIHGDFILNVANIEPRKNQLKFLEALIREQPDLSLVIAGGIRDQSYAQKCREIGGDKLKIIGALPYASSILRSALSGCSMFAMPSLLETPSIAAIEAAAMGCKVLLTEQGSTTEYFGSSVTYVSPDDTKSISRGIQNALIATNEHSQWVARNAYLWPKVMPSLIKIYKSVLEN